MAKNIVTKYEDFKAKHHLSDAMIIEMATNYANSNEACSMGYWADKYNVSRSVFNKARDFAIICCLVNPDVIERIVKKSTENYCSKNPKGTADTSVAHFAELEHLKKEFLNSFLESEVQDIANKYIEGIPMATIAMAYGTGEYGIQLLLKKGIKELIIDKKTTEQISKKLGGKIENLLVLRNRNKAKILECIEKEIEVVTFQMKNYNLYYAGTDNKPTLLNLNERLLQLQNKGKIISKR